MTTTNTIPLDTFTTALESLDTNALAELTAETYAETADAINSDPPYVTVVNGDRQTKLLVVSTADKLEHSGSVDVVVYGGSSPPINSVPADTEFMTPADLRQRLLYAMSPAAANDIAARTLGVPIYSAEYKDSAADDAAPNVTPIDGESTSEDSETKPIDVDTENRLTDGPPTDTDPSLSNINAAATSGGVAAGGSPESTAEAEPTQRQAGDSGSADRLQTGESSPADSQRERSYSVTLIALVVAVALLAGIAGAASVAVTDVDSRLGFGSDPATDASTADADATTQNDDAGDAPTSDGDDTSTAGATNNSNTTSITEREGERITSVSPTCERSVIHVVQLQMNAFRYNNNTTNDGIRTARSFSSPANKRAVGSTERFIEVLNTSQYDPLFTYDSVQYSVPQVNENTAEVDIITRENNNVTGRYRFRLSRVSGGSVNTDENLDDTDSCWMTSGVVTLPE